MLSIKRGRTYEHARRLAALKGVSITEAVEAAIDAAIERAEHDRRLDDRIAQAKRLIAGLSDHFKDRNLATRHGDILYDEHGLPR